MDSLKISVKFGEKKPRVEKCHKEEFNSYTQKSELATRSTMKLECRAPIYDLVSIDWLKDDRSLDSHSTISSTKYSNILTLRIENFTKRHEGTYSCKIKLSERIFEEKLLVTVVESSAPKIKNFHKITSSGKTIIECVADGYPLPTARWKIHDKEGLFSSSLVAWNDDPTYRLSSSVEVGKSQINDIINFRCVVKNEIGSDEMDIDTDFKRK